MENSQGHQAALLAARWTLLVTTGLGFYYIPPPCPPQGVNTVPDFPANKQGLCQQSPQKGKVTRAAAADVRAEVPQKLQSRGTIPRAVQQPKHEHCRSSVR